ncbi:uncharacterized protein TNCV_3673861 [Trichonephila clavipes]|nr:uncharacterized protein TNCV_3673861 [Trichonephila clavipes]
MEAIASKQLQGPAVLFEAARLSNHHLSAIFFVDSSSCKTFGEEKIVKALQWPPRSPDLTPADFWLWGYLKSRVYLSGPSSLPELKDAIRRVVSSIHPDMLHSAVAGFVTRLECLLPCGGGHVEHILV